MATSTKSRFNFPGFQYIGSQDTETHQVVSGRMTIGEKEVKIQMIRSRMVGEKGSFLPANVSLNSEQVWSFREENFKGVGILAMAGDIPVVAFISQEEKVERVRLFEDILCLTRLRVGNETCLIGKQCSVLEMMKLKRLAGEYLCKNGYPNIGIVYSDRENQVNSDFQRHLAEETAAKQKIKSAGKLNRISNLLARPRIKVFTETSMLRSGVPVTEKEWPSLPNGAFAVTVKAYDEKTGRCSFPIEAFCVIKTPGGKLSKKDTVSVSFRRKVSMPSAARSVFIVREPNVGQERVLIFLSEEDIKKAAKAGLNSGTLVALETNGAEFKVSSISGREILPVGTFSAV